MTSRQELLDQWRQRLVDAELACASEAGPTWAQRMRLKLYRFLLAMYGQTDWPGPKDDVDNASGRAANRKLLIAEPQEALAGKEPRSRAEILKGLQNVKGLAEQLAPAGPLTGGLTPGSPIVVAACKKRPAAERTMQQLRRGGFAPVLERNGDLFQIFVTAENAAAAKRLLPAKVVGERRSATIAASKKQGMSFPLFSAFVFGMMASFLTLKICDDLWGSGPELPSNLAATPESIQATVLIAVVFYVAAVGMLFYSWRRRRLQPKRAA